MEAQAFAEVYDIINHFEFEMYQKIPQEFIDMIKNNKDDDFKVNINYSQNINEQIQIRETKIILSIIFRDFICDAKLKQKLKEYDFRKLEAKRRENYNPNSLFKNRTEQLEDISTSKTQENTTALAEYKAQKWYHKIFAKILKLFKR